MIELKSCPFCGGTAKWSIRKTHRREYFPSEKKWGEGYSVQVICNRCHSRGKPVKFYSCKWGQFMDVPYLEQKASIMPFIELACDYWNRRASDEKEQSDIERS